MSFLTDAPDTQDVFEQLTANESQEEQILARFLQKKKKIAAISKQERISFPRPLISINNQGIVFPRNIITIQGKTGVHKSRLAQAVCAVMLNSSCRLLGLRNESEEPINLLYIDTERNMENQFPFAVQQIRKLAGFRFDQDPLTFDYNSLIDVKRSDRLTELAVLLKSYASGNNQVLVVLDVATDCIGNFNREEDALGFVDVLNELMNTHRATFICVLHENPGEGSEKMRGHIGTEIANKASTCIKIAFEKDDVPGESPRIRVSFTKNRNGPPIKSFYCVYDPETYSLKLDDTLEGERPAAPDKRAQIEDFVNALLLDRDTPKKDLLSSLEEQFKCSRSMAINHLSTYKQKTRREVEGTWYDLHITEVGNSHLYQLKQAV